MVNMTNPKNSFLRMTAGGAGDRRWYMEARQAFIKQIGNLDGERRRYLEDFFGECPEEVIHAMQYVRIPRGQAILQAGMNCEYVWVIINGEMSVTDIQMLGNVYSFAESSGTNIIGDYEPFAGLSEFQNSIYAVTACEAFKMPTAAYMRWMRQDSKALFMRAQIFAQNLAKEISNERKYLLLNARDRMVLYLTQAYGKWEGQGECILQKTQAQLAQRIGMNVRTVQRSIQKLEEEGFISCRGSKICVSQKQYERLREYQVTHLIN